MPMASKATKRNQHKKVQQIKDQDGWTHVVRGPRLASTELNRDGRNNQRQKLLQPGDGLDQETPLVYLSLDEVRIKYERTRTIWANEPLTAKFEQVFTELSAQADEVQIDKVMVLGLGSLTLDNMDSSSMHQLVLLECWVEFLRTQFEICELCFQDPAFQPNDKTFLSELGYRIVADQEAYLLLTERTFLFAPYVPWTVIYSFYYAAYPALLVGNGSHTDEGILQPERAAFLEHSVVKNFYRSRQSSFLGAAPVASTEKHLRWLWDMFLYWPKHSSQQAAASGIDVDLTGVGERETCTLVTRPIRHHEQNVPTPRKTGPGEWRQGQGFIFDSDFQERLDQARLQRVDHCVEDPFRTAGDVTLERPLKRAS